MCVCNTSGHWKISQSFFRLRKKKSPHFRMSFVQLVLSLLLLVYARWLRKGRRWNNKERAKRGSEIFFILELSLKRNKCVERAFSRCAVLNKHFIWTNETTTLFYIIYCNNYRSLELRAKIWKLCFDANALKMAYGRMWLARNETEVETTVKWKFVCKQNVKWMKRRVKWELDSLSTLTTDCYVQEKKKSAERKKIHVEGIT